MQDVINNNREMKTMNRKAGKVGMTEPVDNFFCRDCKHGYDYHERNYKGEFFLCKCPFFKSSRFLNRDRCANFERKR